MTDIQSQAASIAPKWLPIETAPKDDYRTMFVVQAFNVRNGFTGGREYTSDPWCVWRNEDDTLSRWPHHFAPTHWMPLPAPPAAAQGATSGGSDAQSV